MSSSGGKPRVSFGYKQNHRTAPPLRSTAKEFLNDYDEDDRDQTATNSRKKRSRQCVEMKLID